MAAPGQPPPGPITLQNPLQDLDNAVNDANQEYQQFLALGVPDDPIQADMGTRPAIRYQEQMAAFRQNARSITGSMDNYERGLRTLAAQKLIQSNLKPDTEIGNQVKAAFADMLKQIPGLLSILNEAGADFEQHSKETLNAALKQVDECVGALKDQKAIEADLATQKDVVGQLREDLETAQGEARQTRADCENDKLALNEEIEKLKGDNKAEKAARKAAEKSAATAPVRFQSPPTQLLSVNPLTDLINPMRDEYIDSIAEFAKDLYNERGDHFGPADLQRLITAQDVEERSSRKSDDMISNEVMQTISYGGKKVPRGPHPYLYNGDESKVELRRWLDRCKDLAENLEWSLEKREKQRDEDKKTIDGLNDEIRESKKAGSNYLVERNRCRMSLDVVQKHERALVEVIEAVFRRFKKDSTDWLRLAEEIDRGSEYPTHQGPTYRKGDNMYTELASYLAAEAVQGMTRERLDKIFQLEEQIQRTLRDGGKKLVQGLQKQTKACNDTKVRLRADVDKLQKDLQAEQIENDGLITKFKSDLREARKKSEDDCEAKIKNLTTTYNNKVSELEKTVKEKSERLTELEARDFDADGYYKEEKSRFEGRIHSLEQENTRLSIKKTGLDNEVRDRKNQITKLEREIETLREAEKSAAQDKGRHEGVKKLLEDCQTKGRKLENDLADQRRKAADLGEELATVQGRIIALDSSTDEAKKLADEIKQLRDQHKQELKACNDAKYNLGLAELKLQNEKGNLESEQARLKENVDNISKKLKDTRDEVDSLKTSLNNSQLEVQQTKDKCETEKDAIKGQLAGETDRANGISDELATCRGQQDTAVTERNTARDQVADLQKEITTAQHLLFDMLLGGTSVPLTFGPIQEIRSQIELGDSRSTQWLQTQLLGDGHLTAGLNALQLWLDVQTGTISYNNLNALATTYRINGYVLAILQDTIVKQLQKPQPWTNDELLTLLRAIEFIQLHCPGTFVVNLGSWTSNDPLTSAILQYVRGLLNGSDRNLGSYLLEAEPERFQTRGLELIPYNKDLIVVDEAAGTVRKILRGNFATFHNAYPVIECEIRLRDYPREGEIWIGLLDEDDEDINLRMWDLLLDALTDELDHGNQVWKDAGR